MLAILLIVLMQIIFIQMPISSESCICGHVLSDIKSLGLGGKRYSGIYFVHLVVSVLFIPA